MKISAEAIAVLRAMRGSLIGRLEGDAPFTIDPGWTDPVPRTIAEELHDAGLIEIDEDEPVDIPLVFRISAAGRAYLATMHHAKAPAPQTCSAAWNPAD